FNGTVGLDLSGSQDITDPAGSALPSSEPTTDETYVVDNDEPGLTSFVRRTPGTSRTNADSLVFRVTFDEAVTKVGTNDFALNGSSTATVTDVTPVAVGVYDVTIQGGDLASFNGTVGLDLSGSQDITDLTGNVLPNGEPGTDETYVVDNVTPALTSFVRQTPSVSPTNADVLVFRATFDGGVTNVDAADFAVNGTTSATVSNVTSVSASVYDVTVSGGDLVNFNGVVGLDLASGQNITDLAGNALPSGEPAIDETFVVDNTRLLVSAGTGQVITNPLPSIEWDAVNGATGYGYWLTDRTRRISGLYRKFGYHPVTQFVPPRGLLPGEYRFEVRAQRPTPGTWTVINFTIAESANPTITSLVADTAFPTIAWTPVAGAATYDLTITDANGNLVETQSGLNRPDYIRTFAPGTYRVSVQAKDADGSNVGVLSPVHEFNVVSTVPATNAIEDEIEDATPLFDWDSIPDAAFYEIWVDNRTTGARKAVWDNQIYESQLDWRRPLDDHLFQWQVKVTGWNGQRSSWTPVKRFTVNVPSPDKPVIIAPAASSSTTDTTPTIDWSDVNHASVYDLWMNNRTTGQSQIVRQSDLTQSEYTPANPLPLGEYSIEVRAANEQRSAYGANISGWSQLVTFTIVAAAQASSAAAQSQSASSRQAASHAIYATPQLPIIVAAEVPRLEFGVVRDALNARSSRYPIDVDPDRHLVMSREPEITDSTSTTNQLDQLWATLVEKHRLDASGRDWLWSLDDETAFRPLL
ncbi:MAG: hypothetical protein O3A00_19330, partial [Planctomycetota bacterium]|nr:hypothetical protein [Planctomycetota bacterium]